MVISDHNPLSSPNRKSSQGDLERAIFLIWLSITSQEEETLPKLKLTESAITKLRAPDPSGKQTLHWDSGHKDAIAGFAVLCSGTTHARTYVVQRTLPDGRNRRVTVGAVNELTLEKARALAADMLHELRHGRDPKKKIDNPMLKSTLETYLTARRDLRPPTVTLYRQVIEKTLTSIAR